MRIKPTKKKINIKYCFPATYTQWGGRIVGTIGTKLEQNSWEMRKNFFGMHCAHMEPAGSLWQWHSVIQVPGLGFDFLGKAGIGFPGQQDCSELSCLWPWETSAVWCLKAVGSIWGIIWVEVDHSKAPQCSALLCLALKWTSWSFKSWELSEMCGNWLENSSASLCCSLFLSLYKTWKGKKKPWWG